MMVRLRLCAPLRPCALPRRKSNARTASALSSSGDRPGRIECYRLAEGGHWSRANPAPPPPTGPRRATPGCTIYEVPQPNITPRLSVEAGRRGRGARYERGTRRDAAEGRGNGASGVSASRRRWGPTADAGQAARLTPSPPVALAALLAFLCQSGVYCWRTAASTGRHPLPRSTRRGRRHLDLRSERRSGRRLAWGASMSKTLP